MSLITIKRSATELPRPKRPIYWSGLGVIAGGVVISAWAMQSLEDAQAAGVVNSVLIIFTAMVRGFFGGGEAADSPKETPNE